MARYPIIIMDAAYTRAVSSNALIIKTSASFDEKEARESLREAKKSLLTQLGRSV